MIWSKRLGVAGARAFESVGESYVNIKSQALCSEMDSNNIATIVDFNILNMLFTAEFNKIEPFVRIVFKMKINNVLEIKTVFITIFSEETS